MPRDRHNPFKGVRGTYRPRKVMVIVLTCVPHHQGYFAQRFEILRLCVASVLKHSDVPFELMIVDNGSAPDIVDYLDSLRRNNIIDHLFTHSANLGLGHALNMAFQSVQNQYVAYLDDDILVYPGWLSKHIDVIETFPRVGFVSGCLAPDEQNTINLLKDVEGVTSRDFSIPVSWVRRWVDCFAMDDRYRQRIEREQHRSHLLMHAGTHAYTGCRDQMYVFRRDLLDILPRFNTEYVLGRSMEFVHAAPRFRTFALTKSFLSIWATNLTIGACPSPLGSG